MPQFCEFWVKFSQSIQKSLKKKNRKSNLFQIGHKFILNYAQNCEPVVCKWILCYFWKFGISIYFPIAVACSYPNQSWVLPEITAPAYNFRRGAKENLRKQKKKKKIQKMHKSAILCWNCQIWSNFNTFEIIVCASGGEKMFLFFVFVLFCFVFWGDAHLWYRHCLKNVFLPGTDLISANQFFLLF